MTDDGQTAIQNHIEPYPREAKIKKFEESWRAILELRPNHKVRLKEHTAMKQGTEGHTVRCEQCGNLVKFADARIHHIDHDRRNNQLSNLRIFCEPCNNEEKAKWLSKINKAYYGAGTSLCNPKERNNEIETETAEEKLQAQLLKQAPTTFQKSVYYKKQVLAYLTEYVKEPIEFDTAVADIVALVGCSNAKAIEYLNGYSISRFSPFRQWTDTRATQWLAPRAWKGTDPITELEAEAQKQLELRITEQSKPVCVSCSKHFDSTEQGSTGRTCAKCMKGNSKH